MTVRIEWPETGVAHVVLDRSAKLNALDSATAAALAQAVNALAEKPALRVAVLRGEGRAFIGGADVTEMAALSSPDAARAFITRIHDACDALRRCPVPVIARLHGHVLGAGLEIAASCDMRIAAVGTRFAMPEVRVGLPSVVEAAVLPLLIGWGRTRRLLLTGETIEAETALSWGLVEEVVAAEVLDAAIAHCVQAILDAGPQAVRLKKALIGEWETMPLPQAVQRGIDCFARAWRGEEPRTMLSARIAALRAARRG